MSPDRGQRIFGLPICVSGRSTNGAMGCHMQEVGFVLHHRTLKVTAGGNGTFLERISRRSPQRYRRGRQLPTLPGRLVPG